MIPKMILLFFLVFSVSAENGCFIDYNTGLFYKEMGCQPIYEGGSTCPTQYDCSEHDKRLTQPACTFKEDTIQIGEELPKEKFPSCISSCKCEEDPSTGLGTFNCATVDCHDEELENETCIRLYSQDSCCSIKTYCKGGPELPTCLVNGRLHVEGEEMYPDEEPCKQCICKSGFQGLYVEPFCKDFTCDVQLHSTTKIRQHCVPIYRGKEGCCPVNFMCPTEDNEIIPDTANKTKTTEAMCQFGNLQLQQYEKIQLPPSSNLECECLVPPYLTCLYNFTN